MKESVHTDIAIIGAGISGLSAAHFLRRKGYRVFVLEKNDRVGGVIRSERHNGFLVEYGPNSSLDTHPVVHQLFDELGIHDALIYANEKANNRYIVRNKKLRALPMSPPAFIKTGLFSWRAKLRLFAEPFIKPAPPDVDETLAEFVLRRLGKEFLDYAINPFVGGVYAGQPELLSVKSAFPKLYALEQRYGSLIKGTIKGAKERKQRAETSKAQAKLFSFQEGLQTMINALAKELSQSLATGVKLESIEFAESNYRIVYMVNGQRHQLYSQAILFTIPAYAYPEVPFRFQFPLTKSLSQIYYPPVAMVYFGYHQPPESLPLDGFGMLVPEKEKMQILGTIFTSTIFVNRTPGNGVALTTFVGGSRQPELVLLPEGELIDRVRQDLHRLLKIEVQPDEVVIQRWEKAIPQYRIGHSQILEAVRRYEKQQPGVFISGSFRGGISVADCIKQAYEISEEVGGFLKQNASVLDRVDTLS